MGSTGNPFLTRQRNNSMLDKETKAKERLGMLLHKQSDSRGWKATRDPALFISKMCIASLKWHLAAFEYAVLFFC